MNWRDRLLRRLGFDHDIEAAERAVAEQRAKMEDLVAQRAVVRRRVNRFEQEVRAALARREHE
jgi:cell division protein FtsB